MSDDERDTAPETPAARAQEDVSTWPPDGVDPREAEFRLAGGEFVRPGARAVYHRQLIEAEKDGYARGHDGGHASCVRLIEDLRAEQLRREHTLNQRLQEYELRIAALEQRSSVAPGVSDG